MRITAEVFETKILKEDLKFLPSVFFFLTSKSFFVLFLMKKTAISILLENLGH